MKNTIRFVSSFLIVAFSFSSFAFADVDSAYARKTFTEGGKTIYIVGPRAPHLFMISRDLYGTDKKWKDIAKWNSLKAPYELKTGQRLALDEAPGLTEAQANRLLFQEWTKLGDNARARQIMASASSGIVEQAQGESTLPAQAEEEESNFHAPPVVHAQDASVSTPAPEPVLKSKLRRLPKEPSAPIIPPPAPLPEMNAQAANLEPASAPTKPAQPLPPSAGRGAEDHGHSHWHWMIKATATQTEVTNKLETGGSRNNLKTSVDPGAELEVEWMFKEKHFLFLGLGYETFEVHGSRSRPVEPEKLEIMKGLLGYGWQLGPRFGLTASVGTEQIVFSENIPGGGIELKKVDATQIGVGGKLLVLDGASTKVHLAMNLLSVLPLKVFNEELGNGLGASLGVQLSHPFRAGALVYGASGRVLEQNGSELKSQQTNGSFFLGWAW